MQVGTGSEVRGIDIRLAQAKTFRIRGRVVKPAGVGAVVAWERRGGPSRAIEIHLRDSENRFELRGMMPGSYTIYLEPEDSDMKALARQTVEVTDHHVDGVVMSLAPAGDIRGTIKLEEAATPPDLRHLRIALRGAAIYSLPEASVADNLTFILKDVVPTRFEVIVTGVPDDCYLTSIRYGGEEVSSAGAEFAAGRTLEVVLRATAAQVEGLVVDSDGKPAICATVALFIDREPLAAVMAVASSETGTFRFAGLKPGDYKLLALEDVEAGAALDTELVKSLASRASSVMLGERGQKSVRLIVDSVR